MNAKIYLFDRLLYMDYRDKYIKYKNKYLQFKNNMIGGSTEIIIHISGASGAGKTTLGKKLEKNLVLK